jgi:hypothetical protein
MGAVILYLFAMLSVSYVLSSAPVLVLAWTLGISRTPYVPALRAVYRPVFAIASSSDTGQRLYDAYLGMWTRIILNQDYPARQ